MSEYRYDSKLTAEILGGSMYKPREAFQQLIDNSLDAGATHVEIKTESNSLDSIERVIVRDNGVGISPERYREAFLLVGQHIDDRRTTAREVSGSKGIGRFAVFALGYEALWESVAELDPGEYVRSTWTMTRHSAGTSRETHEEVAAADTFTQVTILVPQDDVDLQAYLRGERRIRRDLFNLFAGRLLRGADETEIRVNGERIAPEDFVIDSTEEMIGGDGLAPPARLTHILIDDAVALDHSASLAFTSHGHTIKNEPLAVSLPQRKYLGVIDSPELLEVTNSSKTDLLESDGVAALTDEARVAAERFVESRRDDETSQFIERARAQAYYPFRKRPTTQRERVEQSVYDETLVLLERHAAISKASSAHQQLLFAMIHRVLRGEEDLAQVLTEVLGLSGPEVERFADLLRHSQLSAILAVANEVVDRLRFLQDLEDIVLGRPEARLKERSQLQPILERHTWLFGQQYELMGADERVGTVLRRLKQELREPEDDVPDEEDGRLSQDLRAVPDFFLTRRVLRETGDDWHYEHLIVEVKRPGVSLGLSHENQLWKYVDAIVNSDLFKAERDRHHFRFILTSTRIKPDTQARWGGSDRPSGLIQRPVMYPNTELWGLTWSHFLDARRKELRYLESLANVEVPEDETLAYVRERFPELFKAESIEKRPATTST